MYPVQPSQPPLPSTNATLGSIYPDQNDLASQFHVEFFGNIQNNGAEVNSSLHFPHAYTPYHGPEYPPPSVPNMPNQLYDLEDQSPARRQATTHPNDDILQPASMNTGWGGVNRPMEQVAIKNQNALSSPRNICRVSGPPALSNSWSPRTQGCLYELATGEVDTATETLSASSNSAPGSPQGEVCCSPQNQRKKEKDMKRKRAQRLYERQKFERICELLDIPLNPKNNLVHRILVGVEALVGQHKHDSDLRRQLGTDEADVTAEYAQLSADTCSYLPINTQNTLDGSDTGASPRSWPSDGELDNQFN